MAADVAGDEMWRRSSESCVGVMCGPLSLGETGVLILPSVVASETACVCARNDVLPPTRGQGFNDAVAWSAHMPSGSGDSDGRILACAYSVDGLCVPHVRTVVRMPEPFAQRKVPQDAD